MLQKGRCFLMTVDCGNTKATTTLLRDAESPSQYNFCADRRGNKLWKGLSLSSSFFPFCLVQSNFVSGLKEARRKDKKMMFFSHGIGNWYRGSSSWLTIVRPHVKLCWPFRTQKPKGRIAHFERIGVACMTFYRPRTFPPFVFTYG